MAIIVQEWRQMLDNPYYEVSSIGNVRSVDRVIIRKNGWRQTLPSVQRKPQLNKQGYYVVTIGTGGNGTKLRRVHRLVAEAFLEPRDGAEEVNHIDGVKTNNCVNNLEWVTNLENIQHSIATKLIERDGEKNACAKMSEVDVRRLYEFVKSGLCLICSMRSCEICVSRSTARKALSGKRWSYLGLSPIKINRRSKCRCCALAVA